jgi:hypothetical protein
MHLCVLGQLTVLLAFSTSASQHDRTHLLCGLLLLLMLKLKLFPCSTEAQEQQ